MNSKLISGVTEFLNTERELGEVSDTGVSIVTLKSCDTDYLMFGISTDVSDSWGLEGRPTAILLPLKHKDPHLSKVETSDLKPSGAKLRGVRVSVLTLTMHSCDRVTIKVDAAVVTSHIIKSLMGFSGNSEL